MYKNALIVVVAIFLGGCTWGFWYKDFATPKTKLNPPNFYMLSLGMDKRSVVGAIGEPDQVIGAQRKKEDLIETWEYIRVSPVPGPDQIAERYYVEFTNGKLSAYGSIGDFKQQITIRE